MDQSIIELLNSLSLPAAIVMAAGVWAWRGRKNGGTKVTLALGAAELEFFKTVGRGVVKANEQLAEANNHLEDIKQNTRDTVFRGFKT